MHLFCTCLCVLKLVLQSTVTWCLTLFLRVLFLRTLIHVECHWTDILPSLFFVLFILFAAHNLHLLVRCFILSLLPATVVSFLFAGNLKGGSFLGPFGVGWCLGSWPSRSSEIWSYFLSIAKVARNWYVYVYRNNISIVVKMCLQAPNSTLYPATGKGHKC